MTQPYIGQIMVFGFNFAPRNYAFCNGQLMAISQNEALFSILGTTYGGNGQTTFGLPNLQERGIVNIGTGPGLSTYDLGETFGTASVTLSEAQIPQHNHSINITAGTTQDLSPANNGWFGDRPHPGRIYGSGSPDGTFNQNVLALAGGSQAHANEQPFLVLNYCIALFGIFPSRN